MLLSRPRANKHFLDHTAAWKGAGGSVPLQLVTANTVSLGTSLVAFIDKMTALVYKVRKTDISYPGLYKAFDTEAHGILVCKLEEHGCDGVMV